MADSDSNHCYYPTAWPGTRRTPWKERIMKVILDVAMWIIIASLIVLVIMNPAGFSQDVSSISTFVTGESKILTGSGYQKAA